VVALNGAVAASYVFPLDAVLARVDALGDDLDAYHPFHAARGDILRRLGRHEESAAAYARARDLTENPVERDFYEKRIGSALNRDSSSR
jgi:RNA polymerase sigma-70 factor (ECF subfamily)